MTARPTPQPTLEQRATVGPQLNRLLPDRIDRGEPPPGARISETEIAAGYDVSRQPVREAFIKLAEASPVEVRPQRRAEVRRISVPAVMTARFVREAVEADICRVAQTAGPETIRALEDLIDGQRAVAEGAGPVIFMHLEEAFHRTLADAAGQPAVWDILDGLKTQMNRVRHISTRQSPRDRLIDRHAEIVDAIRDRDPASAETAMRRHLGEILTNLPAIAAATPELFYETGS